MIEKQFIQNKKVSQTWVACLAISLWSVFIPLYNLLYWFNKGEWIQQWKKKHYYPT